MFYLKEPLINSILYLALMQIFLHCSRCLGDERADHNIRPNDAPFLKSGRVFHRRLARNEDGTSDLNIATYNLWNIMFHWEVRKMHIADMVCSIFHILKRCKSFFPHYTQIYFNLDKLFPNVFDVEYLHFIIFLF